MHAEHVSHRRRCHVGPRDLTSQLASGQTGGEYTALLECGYQIFKHLAMIVAMIVCVIVCLVSDRAVKYQEARVQGVLQIVKCQCCR